MGGLTRALPEDVPEDDAESGLPAGDLKLGARGDTDRRFKGTTLPPESESQSMAVPDLNGLLNASDGDNDDTDERESRRIGCAFVRMTSAHCVRSKPGLLLAERTGIVAGGEVIKDDEFSSKGRGPPFGGVEDVCRGLKLANDFRILFFSVKLSECEDIIGFGLLGEDAVRPSRG
jgi:hypothetical protein